MVMLLTGRSSDNYSIQEIREYVEANRGDLIHVADIASNILSDKYYSMSMSENGNIVVFNINEREYADLNDIYELKDDEHKALKSLFEQKYVDYIYIDNFNELGGGLLEEPHSEDNGSSLCICMNIQSREGISDIRYILFFNDVKEAKSFENPLEYYNEGGFREIYNHKENTIRWICDNRYRIFSNNPHFRCEVYFIKGAEGIWICREEIDIPILEFFLYG